MISPEHRRQFERDGFVVLRGLVAPVAIDAMAAEIDRWTAESRRHDRNYGAMDDGKMRFDLEQGHCADTPRLRRVANPADISAAYQAVLWEGPLVGAVADLIGPDVKFHHCKLNIKLPGTDTRVDYHQDHAYDPHTNDDHVVALVMIDPMSAGNGCIRIVPGSHRGPRHSHYRGDQFVGKVAEEVEHHCRESSIAIEGAPGDVCLMSGWALHGGETNPSSQPRRLLICDYFAADAFPLLAPMVPSAHTGRIVSGRPTRIARFREGTVELPVHYADDSFFGVQGQKAAGSVS